MSTLQAPNALRGGMLVLVYGEPGTGKTLLGAAFASELFERTKKPVRYLDFEQSSLSIPVRLFDSGAVDVWESTSPNIIGAVCDEIDSVIKNADKYSGLVLDTVTSLCTQSLNELVSKNLQPGKATERPISVKSGSFELRVPGLQDYHAAVTAFSQIAVRQVPLQRIGMPILWLAHERDIENDAGRIEMTGPRFIGSELTKITPGMPHLFARAYCQARPGTTAARLLRVEGDNRFRAKDRTRLFNPRGEDWTAEYSPDREIFDSRLIAAGSQIFARLFDFFGTRTPAASSKD